MTRQFGRALRYLSSGLSVIANALVALMMLHIAFEVTMRYVFSVEVLTQLMPPRAQRALEVFAWTLATVVFAVLAYQTLLDALKKTRLGSFELDFGYQFITWPSYYILPIGFAAITLVLVYKVAITVLRAPDDLGLEPSDEPAETAVSKHR